MFAPIVSRGGKGSFFMRKIQNFQKVTRPHSHTETMMSLVGIMKVEMFKKIVDLPKCAINES